MTKKNGQTAAIMIVRIPGMAEDNLGEYLKISKEEMKRVAHLEIAVVEPGYQDTDCNMSFSVRQKKS